MSNKGPVRVIFTAPPDCAVGSRADISGGHKTARGPGEEGDGIEEAHVGGDSGVVALLF